MTEKNRCVVGGCEHNPETTNHLEHQNDLIKFYEFPARASKPGDRFQRVRWIEFVRISRGQDPKSPTAWTPQKSDKICSNHFVRNYKSENPSKANYSPSIYPKCLRNIPPQITYDLRDLVCWWIKEGEQKFQTLLPIVETYPPDPNHPRSKSTTQKRDIKTLTLVEIDVTTEPHPHVKTYIKVNPDLTFTSCLRNKPVPANALLGESESTHIIGSVCEFECAIERLLNLNLCVGISTAGLNGNFPKLMNGHVVSMYVDGKETERLISNDCEVVANIKVCGECKKLWNSAYKYAMYKKRVEVENVVEVELSVEERLKDCERIIENYKVEVCKLLERNKELREKLGGRKKRSGGEEGGGGGKRFKGSDDDVGGVEDPSDPPRELEVYDTPSISTSPAPATPPIRPPTPKKNPPPVQKAEKPKVPVQNTRPTPQETTTNPNQPQATNQSKNPPQKVLKITREQALLLRKVASNSSGNVIRVQASQLASINKILGRPTTPANTPQEQSAPPPQQSVSSRAPEDDPEQDDVPVKKVTITVIKK